MNITAVLVAYGDKFTETLTYKTLLASQREAGLTVDLIIYDNTPTNLFVGETLVGDYEYHHDPRNLGTCEAYNYALKKSTNEWLMLLDDDTHITAEYLKEVAKAIKEAPTDAVAACPLIVDGQGAPISPTESKYLRAQLHPLKAGKYNGNISGIASTLVVKTEFMNSIGGFNEEFPLDCLDHWLFNAIERAGCEIIVMPTTIVHDLSVRALKSVSLARYTSIISSEVLFYSKYKRELWGEYRLRTFTTRTAKLLLARDFKKIIVNWSTVLKNKNRKRGGF